MMFALNANAKQQAIFPDAHYSTPSPLEIVQCYCDMLIKCKFPWKGEMSFFTCCSIKGNLYFTS